VFGIQRERDHLRDANIDQRSNAEIRAMDIAFRDLLNLADERSHGQVRALITTSGTAVAQLPAQRTPSCLHGRTT
jgi:hypothetical protein